MPIAAAFTLVDPDAHTVLTVPDNVNQLHERVLRDGVHDLADDELLTMVLALSAGVPRSGEIERLLLEHRGLRSVATARPEELTTIDGLPPAGAAAVAAAFELARRAVAPDLPPALRGPADIAAIARRELNGLRRERVLVIVCDVANRPTRTVVVSEGAVDRSLIPVREILNAVLRHDGRAFAIAHNHPSGEPEPSPADLTATRKIADAARVVGLRFLGHIVLGNGGWSAVVT